MSERNETKPDSKNTIERFKEIEKRLLSVPEAAKYLGIAPRTIYNAIGPRSKRPFPVRAKRVGNAVRFDIRDLEAYVESL